MKGKVNKKTATTTTNTKNFIQLKRIGMAWVRGLFVLLTISVNVGVRMDVEPTTSLTSTSVVSESTHSFEASTKYHPFQSTNEIFLTPATLTPKTNAQAKHSMSESVVIFPPNSDQQAKDIYDKALKQFDSYGISTRKTCTEWEKRGCQCSGSVEELTLSCRGVGLNEIPTELPKILIKL